MRMIWGHSNTEEANVHYAFRGAFDIHSAGRYRLRHVGASWYRAWLNGTEVFEGPLRYDAGHPEYAETEIMLEPGRHVLAVQAHYRGLAYHRIQADIQPFLALEIIDANDRRLFIKWACTRLTGYLQTGRQINPLLGWIECCESKRNPKGWQTPDFDDAAWDVPVDVTREIGTLKAGTIAAPQSITHTPRLMAEGPLAEFYAHQSEDWSFRFFTRDQSGGFPKQGFWRRYDLAKVRLGRPVFTLDVPAGTEIEFGYGEFLVSGRVTPYILGGDAFNMDCYIARGGVETFAPLEARGGRYIELHVLADQNQCQVLEEQFVERTYHDGWEGAFECSDSRLNRIWEVGVETYHSCCEDALTDNPTRERGQWTGDVVNVGLEIGSVAFGDLRPLRRALVQAAHSAREDGMVAAMSAGFAQHIASFAAQWVRACLRYEQLTGDCALLDELYDAAQANVRLFEQAMTPEGIRDDLTWNFVDWGYPGTKTPKDMGLSLFVLDAFRAMGTWCERVGKADDAAPYRQSAGELGAVINTWLRVHLDAPEALGFHGAVLALRFGLVPKEKKAGFIHYIKRHMLDCFPNNPNAPRLYGPKVEHPQLITPYFAHFALPTLVREGEMDFVIDQIRTCWGWALDEGLTTWCEVFDLRWSHCHVWSGCPTWMLSRWALGLHPCFEQQKGLYRFDLQPGSLAWAKGSLPLPEGTLEVAWKREGSGYAYTLDAPVPVSLSWETAGHLSEPIVVQGRRTFKLDKDGIPVQD